MHLDPLFSNLKSPRKLLSSGIRGLTLAGVLGVAACSGQTTPDSHPLGEAAALGVQQPSRVLGAKVVGRVEADQRIDFMISLKLGNGDEGAVKRHLRRLRDRGSNDFGKTLTPAQFGDRFAVSQSEYDALCAKLEGVGLTISQRTPSRTTVTAFGPAGLVEQLFGTELLVYRDTKVTHAQRQGDGDTFYAPSASFSLKAFGEHADSVVAITGLDDAARYHSHAKFGAQLSGNAPHPSAFTTPLTGADLRARYGVIGVNGPNGQVEGAGETLAILGAGAAPDISDLDGFVAHAALPDWRTHYIQAIVGGESRDPAARSSSEQGENTLDADMALGVAPKMDVVHVITASNGGLFADGISFVINQIPQAHQASVSYGQCERYTGYSGVTGLNALFMQAIAQGQSWFFSSGDNGTDTCQDADASAVLTTDWPASSPYVFGVGGTQLNPTTGVEEVWGVGGSGGATGGGQSEIFDKPEWQEGVGPFPDDGARDVPDVAAIGGDPGAYVFFGGQGQPFEGTSVAAPVFASVWALLDEARGGMGMPNFHDAVYSAQKGGAAIFTDITVGNNSDGTTPGFDAAPGYDCASGWGTPLLGKMVGALP